MAWPVDWFIASVGMVIYVGCVRAKILVRSRDIQQQISTQSPMSNHIISQEARDVLPIRLTYIPLTKNYAQHHAQQHASLARAHKGKIITGRELC